MKKLYELFKKYQHPIIWTVCYIFITWAILYFLFNFSIFNADQWHRLAHAHLRGFPGFVFGILILSALPLYVATTIIVARKQELLIKIPAIKIPQLKKIEQQPAPQAPVAEEKQSDENQTPEISPDVPDEIRSIYLRALKNVEILEFAQNNPEPVQNTTPAEQPDSIPLPSDFDISFEDTPGYDTLDEPETIPVFTDFNFDKGSESDTPKTSEYQFDNSAIIRHLEQHGHKYKINNNVVTTDTLSIITHNDPDFWVTDSDTWFATGKSCPSPIKIVKSDAEKNKTTPVIYLATQNIMDLETLIENWESDGILVLTDLSNL